MVSRAEVVNSVTRLFKATRYLEIGVASGETFFEVEAARKVAVDPRFCFEVPDHESEGAAFYEVTSDRYFSDHHSRGQLFDVIYIDGLHTFEQTLRDFTNALAMLDERGVIVIDDVVPTSYAAALPDQGDAVRVKRASNDPDNSWMGDTFKLVYFIHAFFPSLQLRTVADNHGQAVVWRGAKVSGSFKPYSIHEIAQLQFLDVVKDSDCFNRMPLAEIEKDLKARDAGS